MFDPQTAIAAWRARLTATGSFVESDLDELESHLRDEIEALEEGGLTSEAAFGAAQERLGDASALAAEFARANPAVAWRSQFFWTAVGCFTTIVAAPLLWIVSHAVLVLGLGLHLGRPFIQGLMWMIMLAPPLVYFAELFRWVRRHQRVPAAWPASPWSRIALLVGGALIALVGRVSYYPLARAEQRFWGHADYYAAIEAWRFATLALAIAAPVGIGALALWVRAKVSTKSMTLFWVGFGCLVALVSQQLNELVWLASLVGGGVARLGSGEIQGVTWGIALAAPVLSLGSAYLWLRHHLPPPAPLLRSRVSIGMILAISGVAVACYLSMDRIAARAQRLLGMSVYLDAIQAWALASLIVACVMPVAIGGIMLRLRNDSREVETE